MTDNVFIFVFSDNDRPKRDRLVTATLFAFQFSTLSIQQTTVWNIFFYCFPQKIGFDISNGQCLNWHFLFIQQMPSNVFFWEKNKKNSTNLSSTDFFSECDEAFIVASMTLFTILIRVLPNQLFETMTLSAFRNVIVHYEVFGYERINEHVPRRQIFAWRGPFIETWSTIS